MEGNHKPEFSYLDIRSINGCATKHTAANSICSVSLPLNEFPFAQVSLFVYRSGSTCSHDYCMQSFISPIDMNWEGLLCNAHSLPARSAWLHVQRIHYLEDRHHCLIEVICHFTDALQSLCIYFVCLNFMRFQLKIKSLYSFHNKNVKQYSYLFTI